MITNGLKHKDLKTLSRTPSQIQSAVIALVFITNSAENKIYEILIQKLAYKKL